jgi:multiple sugar transport system ATP-binding protein
MNFRAMAAADGGCAPGEATLCCCGGHEPVGAALGADMVAGIRPQDIALALSPVQGALEGEVQMVQLLGPEKMVDVSCAGRMLSAIVDADLAIGMGQRAWLSFDPARLHLFDAKSEMNVLPTPGRASLPGC